MRTKPQRQLLRASEPTKQQLEAELDQKNMELIGGVNAFVDHIRRKLNLTEEQIGQIRPARKMLSKQWLDTLNERDKLLLEIVDRNEAEGSEVTMLKAILKILERDTRTTLLRIEVGAAELINLIRNDVRGEGFGVLMADLDGFKAVNDELGHSVGDRALKVSGRTFRSHRESDFSIRWGGDEFLRLLIGLKNSTELATIGHRDAQRLEEVDWVDERIDSYHLRWSIGAVFCEHPTPDERERMRRLDSMYPNLEEAGSVNAAFWTDQEVSLPRGSSWDIARKLIIMVDEVMYVDKQAHHRGNFGPPPSKSVRVVEGELVEF
jgi:diguanylate cyclase (GGDEF)-like protein